MVTCHLGVQLDAMFGLSRPSLILTDPVVPPQTNCRVKLTVLPPFVGLQYMDTTNLVRDALTAALHMGVLQPCSR